MHGTFLISLSLLSQCYTVLHGNPHFQYWKWEGAEWSWSKISSVPIAWNDLFSSGNTAQWKFWSKHAAAKWPRCKNAAFKHYPMFGSQSLFLIYSPWWAGQGENYTQETASSAISFHPLSNIFCCIVCNNCERTPLNNKEQETSNYLWYIPATCYRTRNCHREHNYVLQHV